MRILMLFALLALAPHSSANWIFPNDTQPLRTSIDSALSGDYFGGGFACQLIATQFIAPDSDKRAPMSLPVMLVGYRLPTEKGPQNQLQWRCTGPGPLSQQYIGAAHGPGCPNTAWVVPLIKWGAWPDGALAIRIVSVNGGSIVVRIGAPATVYAGGGQIAQFFYVQQQDPPFAFACDPDPK